jgi:hypothetical protein
LKAGTTGGGGACRVVWIGDDTRLRKEDGLLRITPAATGPDELRHDVVTNLASPLDGNRLCWQDRHKTLQAHHGAQERKAHGPSSAGQACGLVRALG